MQSRWAAESTRRRPGYPLGPAVLCYSRMLFFQINPAFQRFDCKVFLTGALRRGALWAGRRRRARDDRQHACGDAARHGKRNDSRARNGCLRRTLRIPLRGARARRRQPLGARGTPVFLHRKQLSGQPHVRQLGGSESTGASVVRPRQLDLQETYPRRAAQRAPRAPRANCSPSSECI